MSYAVVPGLAVLSTMSEFMLRCRYHGYHGSRSSWSMVFLLRSWRAGTDDVDARNVVLSAQKQSYKWQLMAYMMHSKFHHDSNTHTI